jgi:hypothetical protein
MKWLEFTGNPIKVALHSQGIVSNEVVGALIHAGQQISRLLFVKEQIFCPKSANLVKLNRKDITDAYTTNYEYGKNN